MKLQNANGEDILLFPSFALVRSRKDFALIDIFDLNINFSTVSFVEDESVPVDARVILHTWLKANRDGSRDKRFNDNRQIPVCSYGKLTFKSSEGLNEEYMFSNGSLTDEFSIAFNNYKNYLKKSA